MRTLVAVSLLRASSMCHSAGTTTTQEQRDEILVAAEELRVLGAGQNYTKNPLLCGSWRLVFTTEKARWEALLAWQSVNKALPWSLISTGLLKPLLHNTQWHSAPVGQAQQQRLGNFLRYRRYRKLLLRQHVSTLHSFILLD